MTYKSYKVSRWRKGPLLDFVLHSLRKCDCTVLNCTDPDVAPFRITFEAPDGERMGIAAYAFYANSKATVNRPSDEHRFQVKYGSRETRLQELWQDPFELYTTLFLGVNLEREVFIGADPVLHSPTRFFISIEYKEQHVTEAEGSKWVWWERQKRSSKGLDEPVEVLVAGVPERFLSYVRFERAVKGLDQGHRALVADKVGEVSELFYSSSALIDPDGLTSDRIHPLTEEFQLSHAEILDLISSAPRLKMAVRGWIAERHLHTYLSKLPAITRCQAIEEDGKPDLVIGYRGKQILIECKNVLRKAYSDGLLHLDFQKTRASKADPCSRYYRAGEFDIVAACLHPHTERWEFSFALTKDLDVHPKCFDRLNNNVRLDSRWSLDPFPILAKACV